jgi:hypothetical protein
MKYTKYWRDKLTTDSACVGHVLPPLRIKKHFPISSTLPRWRIQKLSGCHFRKRFRIMTRGGSEFWDVSKLWDFPNWDWPSFPNKAYFIRVLQMTIKPFTQCTLLTKACDKDSQFFEWRMASGLLRSLCHIPMIGSHSYWNANQVNNL